MVEEGTSGTHKDRNQKQQRGTDAARQKPTCQSHSRSNSARFQCRQRNPTFEPEAGLCQAKEGDSQQHLNTNGDHNQAAGEQKPYKQCRDLQEINNHKPVQGLYMFLRLSYNIINMSRQWSFGIN